MLTLGINYSQMHDSSACIVRDGELLFAVAEERLSRLKHDARFPGNAIAACLEFARMRPEHLDEVCFGWQSAGPVYAHDLKCYSTGKMPLTYLNGLNSTLHLGTCRKAARRLLRACLDPGKPRQHVITLRSGAELGH